SSSYDVIIGQTVQLATQVLPASASITDVTYSVKNKKIASVDENGLVTALKGGTTTVYAVTADGSRKRASAKLNVIVPVTGVSYKREGLRVGAGAYGTFTATLAPEDATNRKMTWVSSDESIATVTGTTNRFKVKGRRWGRCTVTGTTEDGGFTVTVSVNVGSLRNAVSVTSVAIKNGKPYLVLKNKSNMDISEVRFVMRGYDLSLRPISMSTRGSDRARLYGTYDHTLTPGASTHHGNFTFENHSDYANMAVLEFAITGWSTSTGYYDDNGTLRYDYDMSEKNWAWVSTPTPDVDLAK
ncbi:MAG: Ig-like domain-containing protein, partial [Eubacteriales bacterium]|nr:Ig-like domain-containing protein [Eubacteriales bacterium]